MHCSPSSYCSLRLSLTIAVRSDIIDIKGAVSIAPERKVGMKGYSGKILIRIPKELHQKIAMLAEKNDESINTYILYLLTMATTYDITQRPGQKEKKQILEEVSTVGQDQTSGQRGNETGRLIGKAVAEELGIELKKGSNKGIYNGRTAVIKSARIGNTMFGVTNKMAEEIQDVILVQETTEGLFDMYITDFSKVKNTGSPTRSKGRSSGRVTNYRVRHAIAYGKKIGTISIDLPYPPKEA